MRAESPQAQASVKEEEGRRSKGWESGEGECSYIPSRQGQGGRLRCEPRTIPRMAGGEGAKMALDYMP
jgi:hypothetical protein